LLCNNNLIFWSNIMPTQSTNYHSVVMGMGKTGLACVKFLVNKNQYQSVCVMDNRLTPPGLKTCQKNYPNVAIITGNFESDILAQATEIIISPGISRQDPALNKALFIGVPIISEIELFARAANAPIVAITGSNGKSTVTTLLWEMAKKAGLKAQVGGNLGTPALDLLCTPPPDLYILELSSFQLESTYSLNPKAVVILNISEDHMDRYDDLADYIKAKKRIYQGNGTIIINLDDTHIVATCPTQRDFLSFSLHDNQSDFRIANYQGESYLVRSTDNDSFIPLLATKEMRLQGSIMRANALAALALGEAIGLPQAAMVETLKTFKGLAHRCAWVANKQNIDWYNDSKGTNVGATIAAIEGLEKPKQIILIAGGEGKGADFSQLTDTVARHCQACVLIGRDATLIAKHLTVPVSFAKTMKDAVMEAAKLAKAGDAVLLSPACASFDMFKNYEERGKVFEAEVQFLY
jgi:UDP-N-acetylmuramoylalanine--D-glutamate ligase